MILCDELRKEGFTTACAECQCFHCTVDYTKLVGAPAWASTSCQFGIGLNCDTCRKKFLNEGIPNSGFHSRWDHGPDACPEFTTEES